MHGYLLSRMTGLRRIAVNLAWVPPGKESNLLHAHHREEEWLFVLEGRGIAEIGETAHEVGPGDFLGYPPGVAHHLRNASDENLVYLEGGEVVPDVEIADFPRIGRRLARFGARYAVYPIEAEIPFFPGGNELPADVAELLGIPVRKAPPRVLVRAGERGEPRTYRHPENPRGEVALTALSRPAGLERVAVLLSRLAPGKESYVHHVHLHDEEWMFVLSGRGVVEVGDGEVEIGPGDFLGFPARGPAHNTRSAAGEDLVYVSGGDAWSRTSVEIVDFPRLGLRKTFVGTRSTATFPLDAALERRAANPR
jgi:uncharacterized cupin superfamily protein